MVLSAKKVHKADESFDEGGVQNSVTLISARLNRLFTGVTAGLAAIDGLSLDVVWWTP